MQDKQASLVGSARRDLTRLRKVSATIVRHGFGELLLKSTLGRRLMDKGELPPDGQTVHGSAAVRFTRMLASLGPTFIKLGQILSMRHDLLSREWIEALETLQDAAPLVPYEEILAQVENALGMPASEAFATFDETPIGTASIAQVHFATTHEGNRVVVKVQRPGIQTQMASDLQVLRSLDRLLEAVVEETGIYSPVGIVEEFDRAIREELDFVHEAANVRAFQETHRDRKGIRIPRVHDELSSGTVLTLEYFGGVKLLEAELSA
ncbi:MAG TPA: AarF/UbiB family protein, partial [Polyangiales bacterium]|nr:AarF/UbiB family protein [Polyangiales bacterium]